MTIGDLLRQAAGRLKKAAVREPHDEAELLLVYALKTTIEKLLAHPEKEVPKRIAETFTSLIRRRARREPFAYIVGHKAFYGREFAVDARVLVPRPSTETLIEEALVRAPKDAVVLDIGTGSGAIALTLAAELPEAKVFAADVSPKALAVARKNARQLGLEQRLRFLRFDVMKASPAPRLPKGFLVIAANLPYLPSIGYRRTWPEVRKYEPKLALVSGKDGLDHYRALLRRFAEWRLAPGLLLLEADPPQFPALKKIVRAVLPDHRLEIKKDLAGNARVLLASKA